MGDDAGYTRLAEGEMEFRERRGGGPGAVATGQQGAEREETRAHRGR